MADSCLSPLPGLVPTACQQKATVRQHEPMARNTWRMRLECPEIAAQIVPGQFFMVRLPGDSDPLLGRPFALYDVYEEGGRRAGLDFGYVVVGKMTARLAQVAVGDSVEMWGPQGNGFPVPEGGRLMLVAGGIGQTPFLAVAREALGLRTYGRPPRLVSQRPSQVSLCYGVRSAEYLAGLNDFAALGLEVRMATDDGSQGHRGFVTDLLRQSVEAGDRPDAVYCCGPEPMMHATARLCARHGISCWLSLESPMACGFGACFSCVVPVRQDDGGWDYRRTCVEGPVFSADRLVLADH